jgi:hypothetical protein
MNINNSNLKTYLSASLLFIFLASVIIYRNYNTYYLKKYEQKTTGTIVYVMGGFIKYKYKVEEKDYIISDSKTGYGGVKKGNMYWVKYNPKNPNNSIILLNEYPNQ